MKKEKQKLEVSVQTPENNFLSQAGWLADGDDGQLLLDVFQDIDNIYIKSTIAGVKPEDLQISLNNDMLTIRGTRKHEDEVEDKEYFYKECYWGSFSRSLILPAEVKSDKISATLKNGVLTVVLPKIQRKRNIEISVNKIY
ncbi:MAG: Hsp20/alpha crystallin family protein [Patescibacteria group bacterium]|jgi:HSP20 family protein